jgi:hypothetical protein
MSARWPYPGDLPSLRHAALACMVFWSLLFTGNLWAHSSSNSYLTLSMPSEQLTEEVLPVPASLKQNAL